MTVDELRVMALKLPAVTEDIKWETHVCFNVGEKMFLVTSPDEIPVGASFKVDQNDFDEVISKEGFIKHKHLGRHNWVHLDDIKRLKKKEWEGYIKQSYDLVVEKLPKKKKTELGV